MRGHTINGRTGNVAGEGHPIRNLALAGAAVGAIALLSQEGMNAADTAEAMTHDRVVATGQVWQGASLTVKKGDPFYDRPAIFNNKDGSSFAGTFDTDARVTNLIVIRGFDNKPYAMVPNPDLPDVNRPETVDELTKVSRLVPVDLGSPQFKDGPANIERPALNPDAPLPLNANQITVGKPSSE